MLNRTIINARDVKRVSVSINSLDGIPLGSGIGVCVGGLYYVLTAAHCLRITEGNLLKVSQICLKGGINNLWEKSRVVNVKVDEKLDCAVLEVVFDEDIPEKDYETLASINILEDNIGCDFILSGYIGNNRKTYKVSSCSENDFEIRVQYTGAEIANLSAAEKYFKGLSGSGLYCSYDNKLLVYAYLCELGENVAKIMN